MIRHCGQADVAAIFEIINDAARAYQGIIPADRWHEPYMPMDHLEAELQAWAIRFHEKHGYRLLSREETRRLLRKDWSIPERQVETSVVLASASFR